MDPNVFRKGNASSCLVVDKTWDEVINKPDFFDELAKRIVAMLEGAESLGDLAILTRRDTLGRTKTVINTILLEPLQELYEETAQRAVRTEGSILADAFWSEIKSNEQSMERLLEALEKAYKMKQKIADGRPLTGSDTLQTVKDTFNNTISKPLLGQGEDE